MNCEAWFCTYSQFLDLNWLIQFVLVGLLCFQVPICDTEKLICPVLEFQDFVWVSG